MDIRAKIMMIDDDPATHLYHKLMMEEAGLAEEDALEFLYAEDAIQMIEQHIKEDKLGHLPKVILVDLNMPKMNGWDFIEELTKLDLGHYLPAIYLVTNSNTQEDKERVDSLSAVVAIKPKYLEKEFFEDLI